MKGIGRRTIVALPLALMVSCASQPQGPSVDESVSGPAPPSASATIPPRASAAFCEFVALAQGDTLADPTIPPAFAAVIAGGDPAPAVAIARDRLLPTLDEGQVLLGEMRTSPLAEDYVAGLDQRTQAFESALNAFVADPSAETATAVDETGRAFDLGLFAQTNVVAVQRDLFATECDPT